MSKKWRYIIIMALGVLMNQGLNAAASNLPVWLDVSGTAMAALVLEPAAGLIVGLIDNFVIAITSGNSSSLIYYCISASVALIVGVIMRDKKGKVRAKRLLIVIPLVFIVSTVLSSLLTLWRSNGISLDPFEAAKYSLFISKGFSPTASCFLSIGVIKFYDTIVTSVIVAAVYMIIPKSFKNIVYDNN